jgi:thiamine-phosphate pyrophosphorylase
MSETRRKARFQLYLITDRRLAAAGGLLETITAALTGAAEVAPPGAVALQLREKDLEARELYELTRCLVPVCARFGAPLLINDRVDVAIAAGAGGVHLPSNSLDIADVRAMLGDEHLIGVSTHNLEEIAAAVAGGADFAVFGPVYEPVSKASYGPATGPLALVEAVRSAGTMPLYALGGLTAARVAEIADLPGEAHPAGIAVIGAVFGTATPRAAARELIRALARL